MVRTTSWGGIFKLINRHQTPKRGIRDQQRHWLPVSTEAFDFVYAFQSQGGFFRSGNVLV